jgi:hypothetical protein
MAASEQWAGHLIGQTPQCVSLDIARLIANYYPWYERCRDTLPLLLRGSHQAWLESYMPCIPSVVVGIIESYGSFEHDCTRVCDICGWEIRRLVIYANAINFLLIREGLDSLSYS